MKKSGKHGSESERWVEKWKKVEIFKEKKKSPRQKSVWALIDATPSLLRMSFILYVHVMHMTLLEKKCTTKYIRRMTDL